MTMSTRLRQVLDNRGDNYLMPFLWMHGESEPVLREEIRRLRACDIRAVCVEARPHPDFLGDGWWHDLDIVMDEARRHAMKVWLLGDVHFPTGIANFAFRDREPDKAKWFVAERHMDLLGPQSQGGVLIRPFLGKDGQLLSVLACPRVDGETTAVAVDRAVDLTGQVHDGVVTWDVPEGLWRIFILFCTQQGGGRPHYMNPISRESVRVLLDTVYEAHYQRYKDDFGRTFAGFFSDEPEFGNVPGYDFTETLGLPNRRLPWSAELETRLRERWQERFAANLPALWHDGGQRTGAIRFQYMDEVTRLVSSCFSEQLGRWCEDRGVEYIGHLIEDDNAHGRLGCSLGHYFRGLSGQHMAGIDVVLLQIMPGYDQVIHQWIASDRDGEFFHYALAKLGASHAHIDPRKQGRAMCEIFGAYGWAEDIALEKFLLDHMLVRGINYFVPHAFSPKAFPDPDCPPHFYAHNKNPQYRYFVPLMHYANRLSHLLSGGRHLAQAAVVYHGEAEWAGEAMLTQKPVKMLLQHQIDCDILPLDSLPELRPSGHPGWFRLNQETYGALIVPYAQRLPRAALERLLELHGQGQAVLLVDAAPEAVSDADPDDDDAALLDDVRQLPCVTLQALPGILARKNLAPVTLAEPNTWLRVFAYRQQDALHLMVMNEHPAKRLDQDLRLDFDALAPDLDPAGWDVVLCYDGMANRLHATDAAIQPDGTVRIALHLEPGQSRFYVIQNKQGAAEAIPMADERLHRQLAARDNGLSLLDGAVWTLAKVKNEHDPAFEPVKTLAQGDWPNLNGADLLPRFSGIFRYETKFGLAEPLPAGQSLFLLLDMAKDGAEVFLNGRSCGIQIASPYLFDVTELLRQGTNTLAIEIANTLAWELQDGQSTHMLWKPTGLRAQPRFLLA